MNQPNPTPQQFPPGNASWRQRRMPWLVASALCSVATLASAAPISMNFVRGAGADVIGVQNAVANSLASTDQAGADIFGALNWNNLGARGTNIVLLDATGAASGVTINWDAANAWSMSGGGTPTAQGSPDANAMNGYLDSNNGANVALNANLWANNNANKPLVYLSGLSAWLTAQGVGYYDLVIYSDGDATSGRVGEYWLLNATGPASGLTLGTDLTTHTFIGDRANFTATGLYAQVPATVASGQAALRGNFQGNYTVFQSLTNDSFLLQTAEFNTRAPINALQIIPRATKLPAVINPLAATPKVAPGATARLRGQVAGMLPQTYGWLKNGAPLVDGGNISGATTATLTIANASPGDAASYALVVTNPIGVVTSTVSALTVTAPVANSYAQKIITNLPSAYWRFNETEDASTGYAVANDYAGGFNATYGSGSLNGGNSIAGPQPTDFPGFEAGNFALQSTYNVARTWAVAPPLNLNTNTATICAWIYPLSYQVANTAIFSARGTGSDVQNFGFANNGNNNTLGYTWNNQYFGFVSGLVPLTNAWSFVAVVVTPTNAILYCYNTNGQLSATNTAFHTNVAFGGLVTLGTDPSDNTTPANRAFNGAIDELAVFSRPLPPSEIYDLYKKGLGLAAIGPVIPTQPKSLALMEGRTANFRIQATGDTPLSYQWRKNGANIGGATTASLTRNSVTIAGDAGNYDVVVANLVGSITSSIANLTIVASNSTPVAYEAKLRQFNPIAYWRMNETNGSPYCYDLWGGNLATNENVVLELPGPVAPDFIGIETTNTAGQYDGFSASTATSESLMNDRAQFSIIGWFNTAGPIGQRVGLFGQNDVCEFGFHGAGPDGLAQIGIYTARGSAFLNQSNIVPNVWYLVAAIGDGTNVSLRLVSTNGGGGFQVLQANTAHAATTNYGSSGFPFRSGGGGILDATGNFFTGLIDEVAVFDRALSVGELSDLFGAALLGGALPPGIASVTGSQTLYAGRAATFQVNAVGTTPTFQWRSNGVAIVNGGNVWGANTPTLVITNVAAGNQAAYDVVIVNSAGSVTSTPPAVLTVITPKPGSYEAAIVTANPLAYYRLNSTNDPALGDAVNQDVAGGRNGLYAPGVQNGFNGILGPVPPLYTFETNNYAIASTAGVVDSYATAPIGSLSTNNVTFAMWIQPTGAFDDYTGLLFNRETLGGGFGFGTGGQLGYTWNANNANTYNFASGLIPPVGEWSFVALVIEPTQARIFMFRPSGVSVATNAIAHSADVFGNAWQIGHDNSGANATRTFNGLIDEVAVFNYALTPAQLSNLYTLGGGTVPTPTVLTIQSSGANVLLTWPQGTLLEANEVTGPWTTNNAVSPATLPASAAKKFYRVIVQ